MKYFYLFTRLGSLFFFMFFLDKSIAQSIPSGFSISTVGSGWNQPVGSAFSKDGKKLFVWEKGGKIYVCNWNPTTKVYDKQSTPVLDISEEVGDWRDHGLLGFTLDPGYDENSLIYLLYVVDRHYLLNFGTPQYSSTTNEYFAATIGRITRYKTIVNGSQQLVADNSTRTILLGESKSTGFPILHESHGVGSLVFASDGTLLASCGDGGSYNHVDVGSASDTYYPQALTDGIIRSNENVGALRSQMINSLSGKIVRLDPSTGNGVSSNPFYSSSSPRSAESRVWALGLRNPFRFSVRQHTGSTNPSTGDIGDIYIGDVGWDKYEELNIIKAPATNCGWPLFEGITPMAGYASTAIENKDEPNPLYNSGGCTQQYFTFNNLIKQATADNNHTVFNPCNSSQPIVSGNDNRFFHRLPVLDWRHDVDSARVPFFTGNNIGVAQIGSSQSGVLGTPFRGNCSVGGCWYDGDMFPAQFKNTYFHADFGGTWLKNMEVEFVDEMKKVNGFSTGWVAIVSVTQNPLDGSLFCTDIGNATIKKISYGGNQVPVAMITSDKTYGPAPLAVNFTGSNSFDPEGGSITYQWDFGDGSAIDMTTNPSHTFTTSNNSPTKFVVKLTVRDSANATGTDSIIISANNTPPQVNITSPVKNSLYNPGPDTTYSLIATVIDAEQTPSQLSYAWQAILRHNNHEHPEPIDTNRQTSAVISRIGCNGDTYYWIIKLTVTDEAGLSTMDSSRIFSACSGGPLPITLSSFKVTAHDKFNLISWVTESESNLNYFEVERSYDGFTFEPAGKVISSRSHGTYEFKDPDFLQGYNYYRLQTIDINNKASYSFIIRVFNGANRKNNLVISPNPVTNEFMITGIFSTSGKINIRIVDVNGSIVKKLNETVTKGFNRIKITNIENLKTGIYIVETDHDNEPQKLKLFKLN